MGERKEEVKEAESVERERENDRGTQRALVLLTGR